MCRDGPQSGPGISALAHQLLGPLCGPSRHKAAPTRSDRVTALGSTAVTAAEVVDQALGGTIFGAFFQAADQALVNALAQLLA